MNRKTYRREFLKHSAFASVGFWLASRSSEGSISPSEKLNIAGVGVGGRGAGDIDGVSSENIVALCDVDESRAGGTFRKHPTARKYKDFRRMLEEEERNIDAVVVATPDNTHAVAAVMAMKMGKHVYVEKPMTHDVYEARVMRETANKMKVATQMGNQGTSSGGLRQGAEVIQSGAIGPVREVHVWTNRPIWPQGLDALLHHEGVHTALHGPLTGGELPKAPDTMAWDLWLGPAPARPYAPIYAPFRWRGWWDFGTGSLGDMACHTMNLPFMALKLTAPTSVEAQSSFLNPETYPEWTIIRYEFPARGDLPAVTFTWYDKFKRPPAELFEGQRISSSGSLMIGTEGKMYSPGDYGTSWRLLPQDKYRGYKPPEPTLPRSPGHHREWIIACKGGPPAMSNFNYSGPLTEMVVLGNVAVAVRRKIEWDAKGCRVTNVPEANKYIRREYRKGWSL